MIKIGTHHLVSLSKALDILETEWNKDNDESILPIGMYMDLIDLEVKMKDDLKEKKEYPLMKYVDSKWACKTNTCHDTCDSHPCIRQLRIRIMNVARDIIKTSDDHLTNDYLDEYIDAMPRTEKELEKLNDKMSNIHIQKISLIIDKFLEAQL